MEYHSQQDNIITSAIAQIQDLYNSDNSSDRLKVHLSDLILDKHFLNVFAKKRKSDAFYLLDVGCGRGDLIAKLSAYFTNAHFVGIDSNMPSIEIALAKQIRNADFFCSMAADFKYNRQFDMVVCAEVYEHVEHPDELLTALSKHLASNGLLSISTPSGWMFRSPRLYNIYKLLVAPRYFTRIHLNPEKNLYEALESHPAIHPKKLMDALSHVGFRMLGRQSSLWWFSRGPIRFLLNLFERINKSNPLWIWHFYLLCDSLMNLVPVLRIFESRFILLLEKTKAN